MDDGSKDGSGAICDEYAEKDSRFRVVHQENKGSSAARNEGLSLSKGIYLSFIDSDDWVENNYLERLLEIAEFNNSDMVICAFYRNYLNRHTSVEPNKPTENKGIRVVVESVSIILGCLMLAMFASKFLTRINLKELKELEIGGHTS